MGRELGEGIGKMRERERQRGGWMGVGGGREK